MPTLLWCSLCSEPGSPTFQKLLGAIPNTFQINCFLVLVNQNLFLFITLTKPDCHKANVINVKCILKSLDLKFGRTAALSISTVHPPENSYPQRFSNKCSFRTSANTFISHFYLSGEPWLPFGSVSDIYLERWVFEKQHWVEYDFYSK